MAVREFLHALEGYALSKGGKRKTRARDVMSRARFEELDAKYPDRPNTRRLAREAAMRPSESPSSPAPARRRGAPAPGKIIAPI